MEAKFKVGDKVFILNELSRQIGEIEASEGDGWWIVIFENPGTSCERMILHQDDLSPIEP